MENTELAIKLDSRGKQSTDEDVQIGKMRSQMLTLWFYVCTNIASNGMSQIVSEKRMSKTIERCVHAHAKDDECVCAVQMEMNK